MLKILHTSDWHLGRSLYGQNRQAEFNAFLNWLMDLLQQEQTDVLLIAGDVFDTITPTMPHKNCITASWLRWRR